MTTATTRAPGLFSLLHAAGSVHDFVESRLSVVGLSIPKLAALQRLVDAGGSLPLGQLAGRLACVKSNVTQLIDRLEADGLVVREPDPNDKRSRLAVITDTGRSLCTEGQRVQLEVEGQLMATLSDSDGEHLAAIIKKLETCVHESGAPVRTT